MIIFSFWTPCFHRYSWLYSTFTTVYLDTCFDSDLIILYLLKQPTNQNNTTWPTEICTLGIIIMIIMIIMTCHMSWLLCHNNTKYYEKIIESMSKLWKVPKSLTENSLLALTYNFESTGQKIMLGKRTSWKALKLYTQGQITIRLQNHLSASKILHFAIKSS